MNLSCLIIVFVVGVTSALEGPNVCTKKESYPKEVQVPTQIPFQVNTFGWCMKPPTFRCRKQRTAYRSGFKTETRVFDRHIEVCCKGYAESGERCIPLCSNACIHGTCAAPEQCQCVSGWSGTTCNISCDEGKWGPRCENTCECRDSTKCDAETGKCICPAGTIGSDCVYPCNCYHEATCNRLTGKCECGPGYVGSMCEAKCPKGKYGQDCAYFCDCKNGADCSFITGECFCSIGYTGTKCEIRNCTADESCSGNNLQLSAHPIVESEENRSSFMLIACICSISLIILVISVLLLLKYKQRLHQLKHELAYVTYIADKPKDRYDNPVYDCKPDPTAKHAMAVATNLNGVKSINNDLGVFKNNIQKAKLNTTSDDENVGACGGTFDDLAIKEGNLNPNIYHNIEDLKSYSYKEPLYDEIKCKGADEEDDNYDHLQYDRPRTLVRPNYDQIDNLHKSV